MLVACGARPLDPPAVGRMVGDGAATLVARAFAAAGVAAPPDALGRFLAIYDTRLLIHTQPYEGMPGVLAELGTRGSLALLTNKPLAATRRILEGLDLARYFPADAVVGGDGTLPRKPDPTGLRHLSAGLSLSRRHATRRRLGDRLAHGEERRDYGLSCQIWIRVRGV